MRSRRPSLPLALALLWAGVARAAPPAGPATAPAASTAPQPPARAAPDAEAIREVRTPPARGRTTSARAIAHYLAARQHELAGRAGPAAEELGLAVAFDQGSAELRTAHAEALAMAGALAEAEAEARRSLELDGAGRPASGAHLLLARLQGGRREGAAALRSLEAAMAIETARARAGEHPDPEPWRMAADLELRAGEPDRAAARLDDAVARIGTDGVGYRELGRALLEQRDAARAERLLQKSVDRAPVDEEAWKLLAEARVARHRLPEARQALLAALRLDPDDVDTQLGLGRLALREEDEPAAREWFGRAQAGSPRDGAFRVAVEWLDARRPQEALAVARRAEDEPAEQPRLRLAEGLALQGLRRWDEAAAALGRVPPEGGEAWFTARGAQAVALSRAGRPDEALEALGPALQARTGDPRLLAVRAQVLWRAGRAAEAAAELRAQVTARERAGDAPALDELYPALSDALLQGGRAGEAVTVLETALKDRPRATALLYALGAALERAGRPEEAVARMRAVLALEPENAEALNFVGYTLAERGQRLDEAEALVRRALELAPRSGHMVDSLGYIRLRRGDARQAVRLLEEADRLMGPDPSVLDHLGDAYRAAARTGEAAAAWRRALDLEGDETAAEREALRAELRHKLEALGRAGRSN